MKQWPNLPSEAKSHRGKKKPPLSSVACYYRAVKREKHNLPHSLKAVKISAAKGKRAAAPESGDYLAESNINTMKLTPPCWSLGLLLMPLNVS